MKFKLIVFIICFIVSLGIARAQNNWELIFENDKEGNRVHGNIEKLISAIQEGKNIRVYFVMGNAKTFVEHLTTADMLTIMNAPFGKFVAAQITPIKGQVPNFEKGTLTLKENLEWSCIITTNGNNDQMTRNEITGEIIEHTTRFWGTKWFAYK